MFFLFVGCTQQELDYSIENYGKENAYILDDYGNIVTLDNPVDIIYRLEISSVNVDYIEIVQDALIEANKVSGINIGISEINDDTTDLFTIYLGDSTYTDTITTPVYGDGCSGGGIFTKPGDSSIIVCSLDSSTNDSTTIAVNILDWEYNEMGESKIFYSHIVFYEDIMSSLSYDQKRTVALHELGHTFGLKDYTEDEVIGYSVMYYHLTNNFSEYTYGDIFNLEWYYTNGGN
ncbi:MAG: hypothetical protein AB7E16_03815 [Candidatus Izemoplasmatales bacterium]